MTSRSSIKYISSLLDNPGTIADGDYKSVSMFRQSFPYFVPVRYVEALERQRKMPFSPEMLSAIRPYMGDWLLFCDFVQARGVAPAMVAEPETIAAVTVEAQPVVAAEPVIAVQAVEAVITEAPEPVNAPDPVAAKVQAVAAAAAEEIKPVAAHQHDAGQKAVIEVIDVVAKEEVAATPIKEPINHDIPVPDDAITGNEQLVMPVYTEDYFLQQGIKISRDIPEGMETLKMPSAEEEDEDKSLMVMMSFSEWLVHFKQSSEKQKEESEDQKALKTMWQKEKMAAAMEEENEEIPENVFELAVNSITNEDGLASESLAEIYIKQKKYDKAIEMYRKLSLRNPQKNAYFARKIEEVLKEKQS